jgi:hypothetical protein
MTDATAQPKQPASVGDFELVKVQPAVTLYMVGKTWKLLNHDTKPAAYADKMVPVATQEQLKEVYDSRPEYRDLVKAPKGYKAPWQQ